MASISNPNGNGPSGPKPDLPQPGSLKALLPRARVLSLTAVLYLLAVGVSVGLGIGLTALGHAVLGPAPMALLGLEVPELLAAAFRGLLLGAGTMLIARRFPDRKFPELSRGDWLAIGVACAVTGVAVTAAVAGAAGGGPPGGSSELLATVFRLAVTLALSAIAGVILQLVIATGLQALWRGIGEEFAEKLGENFLRKWRYGAQDRDALTETFLPGLIAGALSGSAAFHLEQLMGPDKGFAGQCLVQLLALGPALVGTTLLLTMLAALLKDPKEFLGQVFGIIFLLALLILAAVLLSKCDSGSGSAPPWVPRRY